ncbi:hypothetical protein EV356DRAFT_88865 [Viridothelium virens]|uniref:Uncharacterized protein n=1 Tax=Viridothelium virens TaxID=1048519 RepID=A0A6A6HEG7_VIRVR|nr:hypothetical protein EV356DRAFT_88865 [Viridothelium virens]
MEDLPREVQLMLLLELAHPKDLHSLIAASPWFLQIFLSHKRCILASVVRTCIGKEIMPHALRAVHAPYRKRCLNPPGSQSLCTSIQLCRLIHTTEPFVADYFQWASQNMRETARERGFIEHDFGHAKKQSLSYTEYKRIQCAFFNVEEYRRLFGLYIPPFKAINNLPRKAAHILHSDEEASENPSRLLTPETWKTTRTYWEFLNLKSIETYLFSLTYDNFDELDHTMGRAISAAAIKDGTEFLPEELRSVDFGRIGLRHFQAVGCGRSSSVAHMIRLGLRFMAKFRGMKKREQLIVINSPDLIDAKFQQSIHSLQPHLDKDDEIDLCSYKDSLDGPNYGVLWNRTHPPKPFNLNSGFTIWDKRRLIELGFLSLLKYGPEVYIYPPGGCMDYSLEESLEKVRLKEETLETFRVKPRVLSKKWLASMDY